METDQQTTNSVFNLIPKEKAGERLAFIGLFILVDSFCRSSIFAPNVGSGCCICFLPRDWTNK